MRLRSKPSLERLTEKHEPTSAFIGSSIALFVRSVGNSFLARALNRQLTQQVPRMRRPEKEHAVQRQNQTGIIWFVAGAMLMVVIGTGYYLLDGPLPGDNGKELEISIDLPSLK